MREENGDLVRKGLRQKVTLVFSMANKVLKLDSNDNVFDCLDRPAQKATDFL